MFKKITKRQLTFSFIRLVLFAFTILYVHNLPHKHNIFECSECCNLQTGDNKVSYDKGKAVGIEQGKKEGIDEYRKEIEIARVSSRAMFLDQHIAIVTESGTKYHAYGCHHIQGKSFWAYNIEQAESMGYSPCIDCDPGVYFRLTKATRD